MAWGWVGVGWGGAGVQLRPGCAGGRPHTHPVHQPVTTYTRPLPTHTWHSGSSVLARWMSSHLYPVGSSAKAMTVLPPLTGPGSRVIWRVSVCACVFVRHRVWRVPRASRGGAHAAAPLVGAPQAAK